MAKQHAFGTVLKVFDSFTNYAYETVAYVAEISGAGLELDATETTSHESADDAREFVGGLKGGGEISMTIHYDPGAANTHDVLRQLLVNRYVGLFQIVYPDNTQDNWRGLVTSFEPSAPMDDMLTASVTIQTTGFPILDDTDGFAFLAQEDGDPLLLENGDLILINNAPS